ncbi:C40 family peptidase [Sphingobium phenoxybenzoativorans]|uniref:C40 family peptidase n=1 Tax=Sphingobium phenoxybenzoativorans TaxID=1592790 RepID=UPI0008720A33|nr:C40 family peptidase [Sphingobium phenoxybenzoativorans]
MKGTDTQTADIDPPERHSFRLNGRSVVLDKRVHAVRGDLADLSLAGILFSAHYARAVEMTCVLPGAMVLESGQTGAAAVTQLLRGETFHALDMTTHWAWGFCGHDGYVGYIRREALDVRETPTHQVTALSAPLFEKPDIKSRIIDFWPLGATFSGAEADGFVACAEGHVHARHAAPLGELESDWVAVAQRFLGQPYVWGGRGHDGLDCSGLVQIALSRCGIAVPRDTDLQREGIGKPLADDDALRRGDLVFFPGHVGIMADGENLLHANAHWMETVIEPLADVVARLTPTYAQPVLARRRIAK